MSKVKKIIYLALGTVATLIPTLVAKAQAITNVEQLFGNVGFGAQTGLGTRDIRVTIARLINVIMGFLGIVAVIIILLGGFMWMTAGGNDEKIGKAKKLIIAGIIGLIIVISAYAIATFVVGSILNATTTA